MVDIIISVMKQCVSTTSLPSCISIGEGLALPHPEGVIISDKAVIGKGVKIFQQVTLGEWHGKAPNVGDHCELYAGAKLIGQLSLGAHTRVGANAVVTRDSPENVTILAAKATVLPNDAT
jgi:serine O-acetyltransferase